MGRPASRVTRSRPSSNRPIMFMRSVRSSSLSKSTSPDPQMPSGGTLPIRAQPERSVIVDRHLLDRPFETRHSARDRASFKRRTGRTRGGKDPFAIADDQLRIRADIHNRNEPVLVREVYRQHARGRVGADVAADNRQTVNAGLWVNGQKAASSSRLQTRRGASSLRHFDLGDRAIRVLSNRIHALSKEQITHRRIADHDDVVDRSRDPRADPGWRGSDNPQASASAAGRDVRCRSEFWT